MYRVVASHVILSTGATFLPADEFKAKFAEWHHDASAASTSWVRLLDPEATLKASANPADYQRVEIFKDGKEVVRLLAGPTRVLHVTNCS